MTAALMNTHVRDNLDALRAGGLAVASQAAQDFLYASSATQLARLAAVSGAVPRYNGSAWQMVVHGNHSLGTTTTAATSTSGSYADTNLTANITTALTGSRVLIGISQSVLGANGDGHSVRLTRNGTQIALFHQKTYGASDYGITWLATLSHIDYPGSAGAITYKTEQLRHTGSGSGVTCQPSSHLSTITLLEIPY